MTTCENCSSVETCAGNDSGIFPCPDFEHMYHVLNEATGKYIRDMYSSPIEAWRVYMYVSKGIIEWTA